MELRIGTQRPRQAIGSRIEPLARHFLAHYATRYAKPIVGFDEDAMRAMSAHRWPGNVRELAHSIERAILLAAPSATAIRVRDLGLQAGATGPAAADLSLEEAERRIGDLRRHLEAAGRTDEPFEIVIGLYDPPTPEVVTRAEALGVTGLICVPWFADARDDDSGVAGANAGTDLSRKIDATYAFVDTWIAPLAS